MLQTPLVNLPPQKISGVWHLPLRSFVEFIGGEVTADRNGNVTTKYKSTEINFTLGEKQAVNNNSPITLAYPLTLTKGTAMISADDVKRLWGFESRYDQNTNMLMLAK